jgi:hypothetical protein
VNLLRSFRRNYPPQRHEDTKKKEQKDQFNFVSNLDFPYSPARIKKEGGDKKFVALFA